MHPEAAFLAGYGLVLIAVAAGLESLGRRSTHPRASKMLAAERPLGTGEVDNGAGWPHSEVPVFHLGVSGVVLAAAILLIAAGITRHHRPVELFVQIAVLALVATRIVHQIGLYRTLKPAANPPTAASSERARSS